MRAAARCEIAGASAFPRHYLYDSDGKLTYKSALIRYHDWLRRSEQERSPWGGVQQTVPVAEVLAAEDDPAVIAGGSTDAAQARFQPLA